MKRKLIVSLMLTAILALTGCAGSTGSNDTPAADNSPAASPESAASTNQPANTASESVTIKIAGSTSVAPLMKELKAAYEAANSNISLEIQESGSSSGITATIDGAADMGMSSRDLKDEEKSNGLNDIAIALDGIAVIVHPDNPVADLTAEQISAIYKGEISNWSEVGGDSGEIIVVSREEGSGTRGAFEELLDLEGEVERNGQKLTESLVTSDALFENSTGAVKTNIASSKNAIGYISLGSMDDTVRALDVNSVACTVDNIKGGSYVISRPFLVCTLGDPSGSTAELIDFILSDEGQAIVVENSYISVQ